MFWRFNRAAFIWAGFILLLCGFPGNKLPQLTFLEWLKPDKIVHLVLFGVQSYLLLKGFLKQNQFEFLNRHAYILAVLLSAVYGCIVEVLQEYIFIHRSGDVRDAIANTLGALIGLWAFRYHLRKKAVG